MVEGVFHVLKIEESQGLGKSNFFGSSDLGLRLTGGVSLAGFLIQINLRNGILLLGEIGVLGVQYRLRGRKFGPDLWEEGARLHGTGGKFNIRKSHAGLPM